MSVDETSLKGSLEFSQARRRRHRSTRKGRSDAHTSQHSIQQVSSSTEPRRSDEGDSEGGSVRSSSVMSRSSNARLVCPYNPYHIAEFALSDCGELV